MAEDRALSQREIDALLNQFPGSPGADELSEDDGISGHTGERLFSRLVKTYDFRRPDKFSKEQWATLQSMHEHFARMVSASFSSRLRTLVSVRLSSLDQGLYEEWQQQVPNPTVCYVFSMRPLSGNIVVEFSMDVAAESVDRLLGGTGMLLDRGRELGEVELGVLRSFSRTISHALQEMWSQIRPMEPALQDLGQDASMIQVAAPSDVVLTAFFEVSVGSHLGAMSICFPYTVVEPVASALSAQMWISSTQPHALSDEERAAMERLIQRSVLDLSVRLGSVDLPARTIVDMHEGDTFVLDARVGRPLDLVIGSRARFRGLPGQVGSRLGIQIAEVVDDESPLLHQQRLALPASALLRVDDDAETTEDDSIAG